jgi:hypothetical protein
MKRLADHPDGGTAFLFARTETRVFFETVWERATALLFLRRRVSFLRPDLTTAAPANAPSVLIAYGERDALLLKSSGLDGRFLWNRD